MKSTLKNDGLLSFTISIMVFALFLSTSFAADIDLAPVKTDSEPQGAIFWVNNVDNYWNGHKPTFKLSDGDFDAEGWVVVSDAGFHMHVVADDEEHVGNNSGKSLWKNDCIRIGLDAWGDGAITAERDETMVGFGDISIIYSLTDNGPAAYVDIHSAVDGFGDRPDLPVQIVRDTIKKVLVYDITIPWEELALRGPSFPTLGLAVYVDNKGGSEKPAQMWSAKTLDSWKERPICGVFKPGLFRTLAIEQPEHETANISITHSMLNDERNRVEAFAVWSGGAADSVVASIDGKVTRLVLPGGDGLQRRFVTIPMSEKISRSMDITLGLGKNSEMVAFDNSTLRPDYRSQWYAFQPKHRIENSALDMAEWMDAPAGKHGPVQMVDDGFRFADGTPVKFWGVNIGNKTIFGRSQEDIRDFARLYRKYGVNCLRYHKMWGPITSDDSMLKFDEKGIAHWDYTIAEMKKQGVYTGLSMVFRPGIPEGDADMFLAYDEIMVPRRDKDGNPVKGRKGEVRRSGHTIGFRMFARDVQDWHIQFQVNLLNHVNPHTGLPLAKDPALAFVELHNEDSIFFYTTSGVLRRSPTYEKYFREMFSDWLKEKYGSDKALFAAWGEDARDIYENQYANPGCESLDKRNIFPQTNPWYLGEGINHPEHKHVRRRLLDTALFMYEVQNDFYTRFIKAIRETGFDGPIVGSCWQAGSGVPHYYNLHSDYLAGFIDRHEYHGGGGWGGRSGFTGASILARPGTGLLLEGFSQVVDRPFALSEWIGVNPYPWAADGVPIMAAYGLGLQGWDASYNFAAGEGARFSPDLNRRWNINQPTSLGQYPIFARMVYRGDVEEAPVISTRNVCVESLKDGKLGFEETYETGVTADFNMIAGDIPSEALAAGRVVVKFTEKDTPTQPFDIKKYKKEGVVKSVTEQLEWHGVDSILKNPRSRLWYDQQGWFTIDTDGTKALVGFAPKDKHVIGNVTIEPDNLFAVIGLTAQSPDKTINNDDSLLLSAMARSDNTDQEYYPAMTMNTLKKGHAPVIMEPVRATITIDRPGTPTVHLLDHDGVPIGKTLPVKDGQFSIDTARDKTPYYEIVYQD